MNVETVMKAFNSASVKYLLIGGVNYLLRHEPVLTFDIDLWIEDSPENRKRCEHALAALGSEWGADEKTWRPVKGMAAGWLDRQQVFCLTSPHGAIDIFRRVNGLDDWRSAWARGTDETTTAGVAFRSLSDADMLACQMALPEKDRKHERVERLRGILGVSDG